MKSLNIIAILLVFTISYFMTQCDSKAGSKNNVVRYDTTRYTVLFVDYEPRMLRSDWGYRVDVWDYFFTDSTRTTKEYKQSFVWWVPVVDSLGRPVIDTTTKNVLFKPIHRDSIKGYIPMDIDSLLKQVSTKPK